MTNLKDYIRTCHFTAERAGLAVRTERESVSVIIPHTLDGKSLFEAYLLDSVLTGLRAAERGDWVLAFRCLLQAHYENGRLGGASHGPGFQDSLRALQQWTEDTAVSPWQGAHS
jgi:hypothetical protein